MNQVVSFDLTTQVTHGSVEVEVSQSLRESGRFVLNNLDNLIGKILSVAIPS